ncbi:MAG: hypothetical protein QXZ06_07210 [Candidatus Jordarchaeales archaeon]
MPRIHHALGLHFHQPPGNIEFLLSTEREEALRILRCYTRPLKHLSSGVAPINMSISGVLMDQMLRVHVDELEEELGVTLRKYASLPNVEVLATGFYHPIFPLIPEDDWKPHIVRWIRLAKRVGFKFSGFWPPELGFTMKMIPLLSELGFKYVVVDGRYIDGRGVDGAYRPYIAEYSGAEITVIPRNEQFSRILAGGADASSFVKALRSETSRFRGDLLVTTWFDGENGDWLRGTLSGNFWDSFFKPYVSLLEQDDEVTLTSISSFLREHPPEDHASIRTGAWRTFSNDGEFFTQWAGLEAQRLALARVWEASMWLRRIKTLIGDSEKSDFKELQVAEEHLLRAQTSCNFFWEDKWLHKVFDELLLVQFHLHRVVEKAGLFKDNLMEGIE